MSKRKKEKFVLTDEIKNELINTTTKFLRINDPHDKRVFSNKAIFFASKGGGRIKLTLSGEPYYFDFTRKSNKSDYLMEDTNVIVYNSKYYTEDEFEKLKPQILEEFKDIFNIHVKVFFNLNRNYEILNPDNFYLENVSIDCDRIKFTASFKEGLLGSFTSGKLRVKDLQSYKTNFPPLRFDINRKKLLACANTSKTVKTIVKKRNSSQDYVLIDFKSKMITLSNSSLRWALLNKKSKKCNLEDLFPQSDVVKMRIAEQVFDELKAFDENDKQIKIVCNIDSVSAMDCNIKLTFSHSSKYLDRKVSINTHYEISNKNISKNGKTVFDEAVKKIKERLKERKKEIDQEVLEEKLELKKQVDNLPNLFKETHYFKDNEILARAIILFINVNKTCSESALFQFLRGRKMSKAYYLSEGYGAFRKLKESDVTNIINILQDYNILKSFYKRRLDYADYTAYKLNEDIKDEIIELIRLPRITNVKKTNKIYYVKKCNILKSFDDTNIDILKDILNDECLTVYLKDQLRKLVSDSDDNIKKYVQVLGQLEENKKIKGALEYIIENN